MSFRPVLLIERPQSTLLHVPPSTYQIIYQQHMPPLDSIHTQLDIHYP